MATSRTVSNAVTDDNMPPIDFSAMGTQTGSASPDRAYYQLDGTDRSWSTGWRWLVIPAFLCYAIALLLGGGPLFVLLGSILTGAVALRRLYLQTR